MFRRYLARQLGNPSGLFGRFILGRVWNKRNAALNDVTLVHLDLEEADRVLDIGFGGGYLLARIIPQVKRGLAAGLDASPAMVNTCRARYRAESEAGRVEIQQAGRNGCPIQTVILPKPVRSTPYFIGPTPGKESRRFTGCFRRRANWS
jgi:SAM-dependent methyltransferase